MTWILKSILLYVLIPSLLVLLCGVWIGSFTLFSAGMLYLVAGTPLWVAFIITEKFNE